jgi:DNA-binding XRE family transcriptional regulator
MYVKLREMNISFSSIARFDLCHRELDAYHCKCVVLNFRSRTPVHSQPNWPSLISAYREGFGITQQAFAAKMEVSPATISRWESGKQEPNLKMKSLLRPALVAAQLRSKDEWVFRVNASAGHEMLFDGDDIVLAVSDVLVNFHKMSRDKIVGSELVSFFCIAFSNEAAAVHARSRDQVRDEFFSGGSRLIEQITDVRTSNGVIRFASEIWPVPTSDGEILALVMASKLGPSPEPDLCQSYRLVGSTSLQRPQT